MRAAVQTDRVNHPPKENPASAPWEETHMPTETFTFDVTHGRKTQTQNTVAQLLWRQHRD